MSRAFPLIASVLCSLLFVGGAPPPDGPPIAIAAAARSFQPGELVVLTIATTSPADAVSVRAFDRDLAAFNDSALSWRVLVGLDLAAAAATHPVAIAARTAERTYQTTYNLVVRPKRFATRRLTVAEGFVNPPASERDRIEREARELEELWNRPAAPRRWTGAFERPVPDSANSRFGTRSVYNGVPRSPHSGADFPSPAGTPVRAPNAGRVALARDLYFSGNTVIIDHGLGLFSLLAHLSEVAVHEEDAVAGGDVVGRVGATGRVTGPHLHWAVRAGGARVDPLSLLALLGRPPAQ